MSVRFERLIFPSVLLRAQIEASNPMLRTLLDSNPGMRAMMQNPAFIQQMLNPQMLQVCAMLACAVCVRASAPWSRCDGQQLLVVPTLSRAPWR